MVLKRAYQEYTTEKEKKVISIHPPSLNLSMKVKDSEVITLPYKVELFTNIII